MGYGSPQVNHQVGQTHDLHHLLEQLHIGVEVAVAQIAHRLVGGREHIDALEYRAVLDDRMLCLVDVEQVLEPLFQEVHFHGERPPWNVFIVVFQIGVIVDGLEAGLPSVVFGQHPGERRLSASNISCYSDVHIGE